MSPIKARPGIRSQRQDLPDEWRVGLLSPDPSNPRPVFSPPPQLQVATKGSSGAVVSEAGGQKSLSQVLVSAEVKVGVQVLATTVEEAGGEETDLAEEEEVYEMTSMDNIVLGLDEEEDTPRYGPPLQSRVGPLLTHLERSGP